MLWGVCKRSPHFKPKNCPVWQLRWPQTPTIGLTINTDLAEHGAEFGHILDWKLGVSVAGLRLLVLSTTYQQEGNRTCCCAELASRGTISSWSPDFKSQLGYIEIEVMLLLRWGKEGEKTSTLMDYFGSAGVPKQRQLKEPLGEEEEQLTSIEINFSRPAKPGDAPQWGRYQGRASGR